MILGVVSALDHVGIALWKDGTLLGESVLEMRGGVEELPGLLDGLLEKQGEPITAIQSIGVVTGPGSYSGLRGAIAFVQGLAMPGGIRTFPFHTLDVIADEDKSCEPLVVIMDGAPGQIHVGLYGGWTPPQGRSHLGDHQCIKEGELLHFLGSLQYFRVVYSGRNIFPTPGTVCALVSRMSDQTGIPASLLRPEYGAPLTLREFTS